MQMHKLLNVPFLILTTSLIIGIVIGYYIPIQLHIILILQAIALIGLTAYWWYSKKIFRKTNGFSIMVVLCFIVFGNTLVQIHNPKNNPNHYTKLSSDTYLTKKVVVHFNIKERLKPTSYYEKYVISLRSIENQKVSGNLLLQIPKDSISIDLITGESYITYSEIKQINNPLNPYQFNYADHLSKQYIYHKTNTNYSQLIATNNISFSIHYIAHTIREDINQKLSRYNFSKRQLSIINALFLGQRQDIDPEVFADYRDAGAIHILAVSGLHVGILLMMLNFILKPLNRFKKRGAIIRTILIILLLWCFAIIAGLSSSVLRAVTMFSFVAIGMHIRSKTSIYNSLIISIFILLCVQPLLLFSVGFQLSYVAVFAIVWIQPYLTKLYHPRYYIDKKLWENFTVTIAAQLGLLPLSLFYFHQFPLLFFITNLIIIPLVGIILSFGILVILCAEIQILPNWLATTFGNCIDAMNYSIHWISNHETFVITEISFSWRMLFIGYACIISLITVLKKYNPVKVYALFITVILFVSTLIYEKHRSINATEFVIFHYPNNTIIGHLQHQELQIYSKDSISIKTKNHVLNKYLTSNNARLPFPKKLKNIYTYKEKKIVIIDSTGIYTNNEVQPDIVILTNSPKMHLHRIIKNLGPKLIIADGSNYTNYLNLWEKNCDQLETPFHRTDKKGAYILRL